MLYELVKTLVMHRVCIINRSREILQHLTDFWINKNDILRLFEFLELSEYCLLPEKQMRSHCNIMHTFEKTFQPMQMQRHCPIIWAKPNWTSFHIYTRFSLSTSPSQTRVQGFIFCTTTIFTEICRCSSWKSKKIVLALFMEKLLVFANERVVYGRHARAMV